MVRKGFVPDHYQDQPSRPEVDTSQIHAEDPSALFAFGPQPDFAPEPDYLEPPMPESIVTSRDDYPKDVIGALEKVVKAFNGMGRKAGRKKLLFTGDNRFVTGYTDTLPRPSRTMTVDEMVDGATMSVTVEKSKEQLSEETAAYYDARRPSRPLEVAGWMDGKVFAQLLRVGLVTINKSEDEKTAAQKAAEAEGRQVLDVLNGTDNLIAEGQSEKEVVSSRQRLAGFLLYELQPGATRRVDLGDRTIEKKVDADYRNSLIKDREKGLAFISRLRVRSR